MEEITALLGNLNLAIEMFTGAYQSILTAVEALSPEPIQDFGESLQEINALCDSELLPAFGVVTGNLERLNAALSPLLDNLAPLTSGSNPQDLGDLDLTDSLLQFQGMMRPIVADLGEMIGQLATTLNESIASNSLESNLQSNRSAPTGFDRETESADSAFSLKDFAAISRDLALAAARGQPDRDDETPKRQSEASDPLMELMQDIREGGKTLQQWFREEVIPELARKIGAEVRNAWSSVGEGKDRPANTLGLGASQLLRRQS